MRAPGVGGLPPTAPFRGGSVVPIDELHQQVAAVALRAAAGHGFALGGGNALIVHGVIERPTEDVDLFSNDEHGVTAAADAVQAALTEAGFTAERQDKTDGLSDIFYGMGEGLAEWIISAPGGRHLPLQMAYFDRAHEPVVMEFGPVLDLQDVAGGKVCALASRAYERDFADTAALLERYAPDELKSPISGFREVPIAGWRRRCRRRSRAGYHWPY
jgi:hypothetical protein